MKEELKFRIKDFSNLRDIFFLIVIPFALMLVVMPLILKLNAILLSVTLIFFVAFYILYIVIYIQRKRYKKLMDGFILMSDNLVDVMFGADMRNISGLNGEISPLMDFFYTKSVKKVRGFTPEEAASQTPDQIFTPESLDLILQIFIKEVGKDPDKNKGQSASYNLELEQYHKNGTTVWTDTRFCAIDRSQMPCSGGEIGNTRHRVDRPTCGP